MTPGPEIRWAVLGTGGIAQRFAADVALMADARIVAVGSRRHGVADALAAGTGARAHSSYEAAVADPDVDAVYIATPHPFHLEHALLAIAAGRPVLVEKPFTMDAAQARTLVAAARTAGVFAMEAMWTRFLPHMVRVRELLAEGAIGEVVALGADHGQWFAPDPTHRLFAPHLGGGALLDLGVYPFSFASMVLGPPDRVLAASSPAFTGVDATTSAVLTYAGGAQANVSCTLASASPVTAWVAGTQGRIEIDRTWYSASGFTLTRRDGANERFDCPPDTAREGAKGMRYEIDEVGRCLRAGLLESPVLPLAETVSIMATLDEVRGQIGLTYDGLDGAFHGRVSGPGTGIIGP